MRKLSIWCVLGLCCMFLMCSCSRTEDSTLSEMSFKTLSDANGNSYCVQVDQDGFPAIDSNGSLVVSHNKKDETEKIPFPGIIWSENEIYTRFFRLEIPEKWENKSSEVVRIFYEKNSLTAEMTINERFSLSSIECVKEIENTASIFGTPEKEVVDFDFASATKLSYDNGMQIYVFSVEGRTFFVKIVADNGMHEKINFEEIVNTINFRKGE